MDFNFGEYNAAFDRIDRLTSKLNAIQKFNINESFNISDDSIIFYVQNIVLLYNLISPKILQLLPLETQGVDLENYTRKPPVGFTRLFNQSTLTLETLEKSKIISKDGKNNYILELKRHYYEIISFLLPYISMSQPFIIDAPKLQTEIKENLDKNNKLNNETIKVINNKFNKMLADAESKTAEALAQVEIFKGQVKDAEKRLADFAEKSGITQQASYFKDEADNHETQSYIWLIASGIIIIFIALFLFFSLDINLIKSHFGVDLNSPSTNQFALIYLISSKILIFATMAYLLMFSIKNYSANRHNAVVNRHRENSLKTYQALVEAAGDKANKDIVLTKAADSIFSAQHSGYTKADGSESGQQSLINISGSPLSGDNK